MPDGRDQRGAAIARRRRAFRDVVDDQDQVEAGLIVERELVWRIYTLRTDMRQRHGKSALLGGLLALGLLGRLRFRCAQNAAQRIVKRDRRLRGRLQLSRGRLRFFQAERLRNRKAQASNRMVSLPQSASRCAATNKGPEPLERAVVIRPILLKEKPQLACFPPAPLSGAFS